MIPEELRDALVFGRPYGLENCGELHVRLTEYGYESIWVLSDDELDQIKRSKRIKLTVRTRWAHPAVGLEVLEEREE